MMQDEKEQSDLTGQEKLENFEHFAKKLFAVPYDEIKEKIKEEESKEHPEPSNPKEPPTNS